MLFHMFHMFLFIFINCLGIFIFAQLTIIDHLDHLQTCTRLLMLLFWFIILHSFPVFSGYEKCTPH